MPTHFTIYASPLIFERTHEYITDAAAYARYLEENASTLLLNTYFSQVTRIESSNGTVWVSDAPDEEDEDTITVDLGKSGVKIEYDLYDQESISITVDGSSRQIDPREISKFFSGVKDMLCCVEEHLCIMAHPNDAPNITVMLTRSSLLDPFNSDYDVTEYSDSEVRKNFHGFVHFLPVAG